MWGANDIPSGSAPMHSHIIIELTSSINNIIILLIVNVSYVFIQKHFVIAGKSKPLSHFIDTFVSLFN